MSNAVSDVVSIYVKVGQLASDQLVDIIISDIQPVLLFLLQYFDENLFSQQWLDQEVDPVGNAVETVNDYLTDFQKWISCQYYIGYILRGCLEKIIGAYFQSFKNFGGWKKDEIDRATDRICDDENV